MCRLDELVCGGCARRINHASTEVTSAQTAPCVDEKMNDMYDPAKPPGTIRVCGQIGLRSSPDINPVCGPMVDMDSDHTPALYRPVVRWDSDPSPALSRQVA